MRSPQTCGRVFASSAIAFCIGLGFIPIASADPADGDDPGVQAPVVGAPAPTAFTPESPDADSAALDACKQFGAAMNYAAANYEDFAYATAGNGNAVNYGDPSIDNSNVVGRTALREASSVAMSAAGTPGLSPDIAGPMQSWSMNAMKLIVMMGVHAGGDALNGAATDLNTDSRKVQMACAAAGTKA
jgi:hypothetical protein